MRILGYVTWVSFKGSAWWVMQGVNTEWEEEGVPGEWNGRRTAPEKRNHNGRFRAFLERFCKFRERFAWIGMSDFVTLEISELALFLQAPPPCSPSLSSNDFSAT